MMQLIERAIKRVQSVGTRIGFMAERPEDGHTEYGPEWYDRYFENVSEYRVHYSLTRYYFLWTVITDRLRRAGVRRVLEIGCGAGQLAALLLDQGIEEYVGLDFSASAIDLAAKSAPRGRFLVGDARSSAVYAEVEYDAIICTEVLEHIEDDLQVLSRFPTGKRCLCSVPNFPYESHVRYFKDASEVQARYGPFFADLSVTTFQGVNAIDQKYFLADGVRNNLRVDPS